MATTKKADTAKADDKKADDAKSDTTAQTKGTTDQAEQADAKSPATGSPGSEDIVAKNRPQVDPLPTEEHEQPQGRKNWDVPPQQQQAEDEKSG